MIVRKDFKRSNAEGKADAVVAGVGICANDGGPSDLWFDSHPAAAATSVCETTCHSGRSDSEFDDDWLGWMPAIPREGEADYDDLKTLESACDFNLGSEVGLCKCL